MRTSVAERQARLGAIGKIFGEGDGFTDLAIQDGLSAAALTGREVTSRITA